MVGGFSGTICGSIAGQLYVKNVIKDAALNAYDLSKNGKEVVQMF